MPSSWESVFSPSVQVKLRFCRLSLTSTGESPGIPAVLGVARGVSVIRGCCFVVGSGCIVFVGFGVDDGDDGEMIASRMLPAKQSEQVIMRAKRMDENRDFFFGCFGGLGN